MLDEAAARPPPRKHDCIAVIILDGNSQVCFDKTMLAKAKAKTTMHAVMHAVRPIIS